MIYSQPGPLEPVDQADLIDGVPLLEVQELNLDDPANPVIGCAVNRVIVLTQTCDLAQRKANRITVARVFDAEELIAHRMAKATDIRGPIRSSRVWGLYFLPASRQLGLAEMVIDLRQVHCIPLDVLAGQRHVGTWGIWGLASKSITKRLTATPIYPVLNMALSS